MEDLKKMKISERHTSFLLVWKIFQFVSEDPWDLRDAQSFDAVT